MTVKSGHEKLRYRVVYALGRLITPLLLSKYKFRTDKIKKTDENYLVLSNHLTEVDVLMVSRAFKEHMFFVAGEHVSRAKHAKFFEWAEDPIYEFKGSVPLKTVTEIVHRIKKGNNVMLFPEGSRSFHGETLPLPDSIAKLAKLTGGGLVTYRIEGGYFTAPRWAYTERTGPMSGHVVHEYTAKELSAMSVAELTEKINADLYENAYERQKLHPYPYRGKRLAEGLENYLVKCPKCGAFDSLTTKDDTFTCVSCGLSGRYTETGFLEGEGLPYDTVIDWGKWAEEETAKYVREHDDETPCFSDENVSFFEVTDDHVQTELGTGSIKGYRDRIEVLSEVFPMRSIRAVNMLYFGKTLLFTANGRHLGVTGEAFHAIRYEILFHQMKRETAT